MDKRHPPVSAVFTSMLLLAVCESLPRVRGQERIQAPPAATESGNAAEIKALQDSQAAYVKAFNAGAAKSLAAFWANDGEFVDAQGRSFRGRDAINQEFAAFFAETKGARLEIATDSLRFVSPGVALESGTARVTGTGNADSTAAYNIVHVKRDGRWELASVRETPVASASNYERLRDLEWLVGTWSAQSGGQSLEVTCEWTTQRSFLTRRYILKSTSGTSSGLQVIGWDPVAGKIRSWVFDSAGGFGSEWWTRDGRSWLLEATATTRDGAQTLATNVLTPLDRDTFTWQSIQRSLNQVRLPDTALIKVTRVTLAK